MRSGRYRRALVERGDALVQIQLGAKHKNGIEIDRDCEEAAWRFREVAEQGDAQAAYCLAELLVSGRIYAPSPLPRLDALSMFTETEDRRNKRAVISIFV